MKRLLLFLLMAFVFASTAEAQANKKKAAAAPAKATKPASLAVAPKLSTKEPAFAGFTGSFMQFGNVSGNNRPFTMAVEYKQWIFEVKGTANAGHNTPDLDALLEDIVAVVAYYDAVGKAADGTDYQAGLFDLMIYLEDSPIKVSDLNFTLKGKAAQGSSIITQAKKWNFEPGQVFKTQKYSSAIFKAQAATLDKSDIEREEKAEKKRVADSIAKVEKMKRDSIAKVEKMKRDSIAKVEKMKKKRKKPVVEDDEDEDEDEPPRKKRKKRK
jgi:hypothetical protein